jgi:hypothetical protein
MRNVGQLHAAPELDLPLSRSPDSRSPIHLLPEQLLGAVHQILQPGNRSGVTRTHRGMVLTKDQDPPSHFDSPTDLRVHTPSSRPAVLARRLLQCVRFPTIGREERTTKSFSRFNRSTGTVNCALDSREVSAKS